MVLFALLLLVSGLLVSADPTDAPVQTPAPAAKPPDTPAPTSPPTDAPTTAATNPPVAPAPAPPAPAPTSPPTDAPTTAATNPPVAPAPAPAAPAPAASAPAAPAPAPAAPAPAVPAAPAAPAPSAPSSSHEGSSTDEPVEGARELYAKYTQNFSIAGIVFGIILLFRGWPWLRLTIFMTGFGTFGLTALALLVVGELEDGLTTEAWTPKANLILCLVFGFMGGIFTSQWNRFATFLIGASQGVLVAVMLNTSGIHALAQTGSVQRNEMFAIVAGSLAFLCGLLTLWLKKPIIIFSTSLIGAYGIIRGIVHLLERYDAWWPNEWALMTPIAFKEDNPHEFVPLEWFCYVGAVVLLSFIGMYVQFSYTYSRTKLVPLSSQRSGHPLDQRSGHPLDQDYASTNDTTAEFSATACWTCTPSEQDQEPKCKMRPRPTRISSIENICIQFMYPTTHLVCILVETGTQTPFGVGSQNHVTPATTG
eukprot:g69120.t1